MYSHEELVGGWVGELLEVEDVDVVFGEEACYGVDYTWFIGTR